MRVMVAPVMVFLQSYTSAVHKALNGCTQAGMMHGVLAAYVDYDPTYKSRRSVVWTAITQHARRTAHFSLTGEWDPFSPKPAGRISVSFKLAQKSASPSVSVAHFENEYKHKLPAIDVEEQRNLNVRDNLAVHAVNFLITGFTPVAIAYEAYPIVSPWEMTSPAPYI